MGVRSPGAGAAVVYLVLTACGRASTAGGAVSDGPPAPDGIAALDPLLRTAIEEEVARVVAEPEEAARWRALGELYYANGFYIEAEGAYAGALERNPDDPLAWYGRALAAVVDGRTEEARAFAAKSLELDPTYAPGFWRIGEWCLAEGQLDEAVAWYQRAQAANPAHPGGWIGLARVHLQRGEFQPAAELLLLHVLGGPCDGYGRQLLATAFQHLGRAEEARTLAAQGKGSEPSIPDARFGQILAKGTGRRADIERASALVRSKRAREAVPILEQLHASEPEDPATLSNLAFALLEAGRLDEAEARAREAAELDPAAYRPLLVQGLIAMRRGEAWLPQALALLRRAVDIQPAAADALAPLGLVLVQLGDDAGGLDAYRRAAALDPENLELLQNVGLLERRLGRYEAAEATYRALLDLAPGHLIGTVALAEVRSARGDPAGAEALLRGALKTLAPAGAAHPDVRPVRERLIAALEAQGKTAEAAAERARL